LLHGHYPVSQLLRTHPIPIPLPKWLFLPTLSWITTPEAWASQVPRSFLQSVPSPSTPSSPWGARASCFPHGNRFHQLWMVDRCHFILTRPFQCSLTLRLTLSLSQGLRPCSPVDTNRSRSPRAVAGNTTDRSFMSNWQFT
jgi:hypothetical protein